MKTAAFYSYKGGVGRSLFVANLSIFLARFAAKKVLTIDLDLEAPGLHYKYEETGLTVQPIAAGLVDTLHDYLYADEPPATLPIFELKQFPEGAPCISSRQAPRRARPTGTRWRRWISTS